MVRQSAVLAVATIASYGYALLRHGPGPSAQSQAFTTLSLGQLLHALHCRAPDRRLRARPPLAPNPRLQLALAALSALQLAAIAVPPLRKLLKLGPLGPLDALVAAAAAVGPLFVNEMAKPRASTAAGDGADRTTTRERSA
jgi:Ca2+-transporting ATPase